MVARKNGAPRSVGSRAEGVGLGCEAQTTSRGAHLDAPSRTAFVDPAVDRPLARTRAGGDQPDLGRGSWHRGTRGSRPGAWGEEPGNGCARDERRPGAAGDAGEADERLQ